MPSSPPDPAGPAPELAPAALRAAFSAAFGGGPDGRDHGDDGDDAAVDVVRAPGRVNLIGEHTDYNDGLVLPVAIDLEMRIARRRRVDRRVRLALVATGETGELDLDRIGDPTGTWIDYLAGTAREMAAAGLRTGGFDGVLASTVPVASGLSSSAALELASAWALSGRDGPPIDGLGLARIAQRAENEYVGVRCGLMDQFASACGVAGSAVLLDCRSLEHRAVPLPPGARPRRRPHGDAADARDLGVQRPARRLRAGGRRPGRPGAGDPRAARRRPPDARPTRRPARPGRPPAGRARRRRERPGRRHRGRAPGRRSRRRRAPVRGEPRLAPRSLRGELAGARRAWSRSRSASRASSPRG